MSTVVPIDVDAFRKAVNAEIKKESEHVLSGRCGTFDEYKRRTGRIDGLTVSMESFNAILNKDDTDD